MRGGSRASLAGPAALVLGLLLSSPAAGGIFEVTDCGDTTPGGGPGQLRTLVGTVPSQSIIVVPACTITLTGAAGDDANQTGDLDVLDFRSIIIRGAGVGRTILDGGGLDRVFHLVTGDLDLADVTVRGGVAADGGGGIKAEAFTDLVLRRVEVAGNTTTGAASSGGGVQALGRDVTLDRSTVRANTAPAGSGGGMAVTGNSLTVERSTISGNIALAGGGLALAGPSLQTRITQSTISGNRATGPAAAGEGAGVHSESGELTWVLHSTLVENTSESGTTGGLFSQAGSGFFLRSTIVAANAPASCGGPAPIVSAGHNIRGDPSCPLALATDLTAADPGLAPLADGGGPTATHGLLPGGPAIDASGEAGCPSVDQRGARRPQDGDGNGEARCDIGAVERQSQIPDAVRSGSGGAP